MRSDKGLTFMWGGRMNKVANFANVFRTDQCCLVYLGDC